jgi:hypothetical protein
MSKLKKTNGAGKHYWEREESAGKPFLIAIADFHKPADRDMLGSMTYTQSALYVYLYGQRVYWFFDESGTLIVSAEPVGEHRCGEKVVPSGFLTIRWPPTSPRFSSRMPAPFRNSTGWGLWPALGCPAITTFGSGRK